MKLTIEIPDDQVELVKKLCIAETHQTNELNGECVHWFFHLVADAINKPPQNVWESWKKHCRE